MKLHREIRLSIPDPMILALGLSLVTMILALVFGTNQRPGILGAADVLSYWTMGFWDLLSFSMQMVLILLLGYMLALSPALDNLSSILAKLGNKPVLGAVIISVVAIVVGLINWGLALVLGAVLVKKTAIQAKRSGFAINYPLMGSAAYLCMMIWHGGLSGSAPLSVSSENHFLIAKTGIIPLSSTIFSPMNITATALLLILLPLSVWFFARKGKNEIPEDNLLNQATSLKNLNKNWRPGFLSFFGILLLIGLVFKIIAHKNSSIGLNEINLILFSFVLIVFPNVDTLSKATGDAIGSTAGIIIQFPLYAGIMGIMQHSGLLSVMTDWFVDISNQHTFPLFSFFSAGLVNLFVPSGG
ncbi:MAG: TIGR00366 family protein, partial [Thiovulaceae bacterium]|nr:TIGR00366 family protein [Sulfurimonadaceae bacterium]